MDVCNIVVSSCATFALPVSSLCSFLFNFSVVVVLIVLVALTFPVLVGCLAESEVLKSPILMRNGSSGSSLKAT